jgi:hypothetical protein
LPTREDLLFAMMQAADEQLKSTVTERSVL